MMRRRPIAMQLIAKQNPKRSFVHLLCQGAPVFCNKVQAEWNDNAKRSFVMGLIWGRLFGGDENKNLYRQIILSNCTTLLKILRYTTYNNI